jgi:ADP-ribose pyrophosphatase YjhB (NUDIX family)
MTGGEFVFCPLCATSLVERVLYGKPRRVCPQCGFVRFRDPKVAVIALVTSGPYVLLVQRGVEPEKGKWSLPGGYMDAGEMPEAALQRELLEEVGFYVGALRFLDIFPIAASAGPPAGIVLAYAASPVGETRPQPVSADDVSDARWFSVENLPDDLAFASTRSLLGAWSKGQMIGGIIGRVSSEVSLGAPS